LRLDHGQRARGGFAFPNPLLGVAGFPVVAATGAALLGGAPLAGWFWAALQVGVSAAVLFVHC